MEGKLFYHRVLANCMIPPKWQNCKILNLKIFCHQIVASLPYNQNKILGFLKYVQKLGFFWRKVEFFEKIVDFFSKSVEVANLLWNAYEMILMIEKIFLAKLRFFSKKEKFQIWWIDWKIYWRKGIFRKKAFIFVKSIVKRFGGRKICRW